MVICKRARWHRCRLHSGMFKLAARYGRGSPLVALAAGIGMAGSRSASGSCDGVRLLRCGDAGLPELAAELPGSRGVTATLALPMGRLAGAGVIQLRLCADCRYHPDEAVNLSVQQSM